MCAFDTVHGMCWNSCFVPFSFVVVLPNISRGQTEKTTLAHNKKEDICCLPQTVYIGVVWCTRGNWVIGMESVSFGLVECHTAI